MQSVFYHNVTVTNTLHCDALLRCIVLQRRGIYRRALVLSGSQLSCKKCVVCVQASCILKCPVWFEVPFLSLSQVMKWSESDRLTLFDREFARVYQCHSALASYSCVAHVSFVFVTAYCRLIVYTKSVK